MKEPSNESLCDPRFLWRHGPGPSGAPARRDHWPVGSALYARVDLSRRVAVSYDSGTNKWRGRTLSLACGSLSNRPRLLRELCQDLTGAFSPTARLRGWGRTSAPPGRPESALNCRVPRVSGLRAGRARGPGRERLGPADDRRAPSGLLVPLPRQ